MLAIEETVRLTNARAAGTARAGTPRWVHLLAIGTVLAALPLFFLGADVTTKGAGMADQRSFVLFWQAIGEMLRGGQSHGWVIEHLHRLAGWFIGFCGIALAASLWWQEPRGRVCWLATGALGLIVVQGLLGIFRVQLHALFGPNLAWLHGSFAPLVLAALTAVAVLTSATTARVAGLAAADASARRFATLAWVVSAAVYAQLVLGGMVRHRDFFAGARLHVAMAFVVAVAVMWVCLTARGRGTAFFRWTLALLLAAQLLLGIEAWLSRFHHPVLPWNQLQPLLVRSELVRTLHFVAGSLLFAACVGFSVLLTQKARLQRGEGALA